MEVAEITGVLGLGAQIDTSVELMRMARRGFSVVALDRLVTSIAPDDGGLKYRLIPRATLARKRAGALLSADQSEKLARLARIWVFAREVWGGDGAARDFLMRPHAMLEDQTPLDVVIESETGAELVREILGRLQFGSAA